MESAIVSLTSDGRMRQSTSYFASSFVPVRTGKDHRCVAFLTCDRHWGQGVGTGEKSQNPCKNLLRVYTPFAPRDPQPDVFLSWIPSLIPNDLLPTSPPTFLVHMVFPTGPPFMCSVICAGAHSVPLCSQDHGSHAVSCISLSLWRKEVTTRV